MEVTKVSQEGRAISGASAVPGHQEQTTMAPPPPRRLWSHPFIGQSPHPSLKGSEIKEQETRTSSKIVEAVVFSVRRLLAVKQPNYVPVGTLTWIGGHPNPEWGGVLPRGLQGRRLDASKRHRRGLEWGSRVVCCMMIAGLTEVRGGRALSAWSSQLESFYWSRRQRLSETWAMQTLSSGAFEEP